MRDFPIDMNIWIIKADAELRFFAVEIIAFIGEDGLWG